MSAGTSSIFSTDWDNELQSYMQAANPPQNKTSLAAETGGRNRRRTAQAQPQTQAQTQSDPQSEPEPNLPTESLLGGNLEPYCGDDADRNKKARSSRCTAQWLLMVVVSLVIYGLVAYIVARTVAPPPSPNEGGVDDSTENS